MLNAPEGDRFAVLFTYASGQKQHLLPAKTHFQVGQLIARLHGVTNSQKLNRVDYTPEVILVDSLKKVAEFLPAGTEEFSFMLSGFFS